MLTRRDEIDTAAEELLRYLETADGEASGAARRGFSAEENVIERRTTWPVDEELRRMREVRPQQPQTAAGEMRRYFEEAAADTEMPHGAVAAADDLKVPAAEWLTMQGQSAAEKQTMDDISEFFRRDSRRYDKAAGGDGV